MYEGLFKVYGQSTSFTGFNGDDKGANDVSVCRGVPSDCSSRKFHAPPFPDPAIVPFLSPPSFHSCSGTAAPCIECKIDVIHNEEGLTVFTEGLSGIGPDSGAGKDPLSLVTPLLTTLLFKDIKGIAASTGG
ncbi:hypothetical protein V502_04259 [Pseudogymnoascus sp. VKM F-4520 (FW-2644)]|nr:hypothetical protein V502_04259 [Pseudogymnoascus sp. VKM F-4520 (FW-2644)]